MRDLGSCSIVCSSRGGSWGDENDHVDVVREVRGRGIHWSARGGDMAAEKGHLDVVRDLRAHDIRCTSRGANWAAENGHLDVRRDIGEPESVSVRGDAARSCDITKGTVRRALRANDGNYVSGSVSLVGDLELQEKYRC